MIIRCPSCSTTYKVDGSVFDAPKPTFRCSRCKHVFTFEVRLQLQDEDPALNPDAGDPAPETDADGDGAEAGDAFATVEEPSVSDREDTLESEALEEEPVPPDPGTDQGVLELPHAEAEPAAREAAETEAAHDDDDARYSYPDVEPVVADPPDAERPASPQSTAAVEAEVPVQADVPARNAPRPDFEIDDDFLIPPRRETKPPPPVRTSSWGSIVPVASVVALAVSAFVLVTLIYQVNPQPLDSLLRRIPWYGGALFENRHFKKTLVFESLASGVQPVMNQTEVFVVSGKLVNRNDRSVHGVRIEARLFDAEGREVGRQVTFVGNAISAKIIQDMTFREIELLQSLKPQSAYRIPASESAGFTIVFPKPKAAVESFSCRVLSAEAAA